MAYETTIDALSIAAVALLALVVVALEVRSPDCTRSSHLGLFLPLLRILGPLSILAAFGSVAAYALRRGARPLGAFVAATVLAAFWAVLGGFIVLASYAQSGCLS